jgi:hypothetical protein
MIQIYVPKDLRVQMTQVQQEEGWSNADLVLRAVEETQDRLPATTHPPRVGAGLFSRSYRPRKPLSEDAIQVGVRLTGSDIAQIDRLVSAAHTPSRSAYIVAALNSFVSSRLPQETSSE